jgi:predicted DNA-binding transcriptional regulator YafY
MADNFFRLLRMLGLLQTSTAGLTARDILDALTRESFEVDSLRTVQRDLKTLEGGSTGIQCVTTSKPHRWRYLASADLAFRPALDAQTALALRLCEQHLEEAVPVVTRRALRDRMKAAQQTLHDKRLARWLDRVRLLPRQQPLTRPHVAVEIQEVVQEALFDETQIEARYRTRKGDLRELALHPLGLVVREHVTYVVATAFDYGDPRIYPLHRFVAARRTTRPVAPRDFDLDAFLKGGELDWRIGDDEVDLVLIVEPHVAFALQETPLHPGQLVRPRDDGRIELRARLPDTKVLRAWILGYGGDIEVQAPPSMRADIAAAHRGAAARYAPSWSEERPANDDDGEGAGAHHEEAGAPKGHAVAVVCRADAGERRLDHGGQ